MDALVYLTETIRAKVCKDKFVTASLLDLRKPFDSIDHPLSIRKLQNKDLKMPSFDLINRHLTIRYQNVLITDAESDWNLVSKSVPK